MIQCSKIYQFKRQKIKIFVTTAIMWKNYQHQLRKDEKLKQVNALKFLQISSCNQQ